MTWWCTIVLCNPISFLSLMYWLSTVPIVQLRPSTCSCIGTLFPISKSTEKYAPSGSSLEHGSWYILQRLNPQTTYSHGLRITLCEHLWFYDQFHPQNYFGLMLVVKTSSKSHIILEPIMNKIIFEKGCPESIGLQRLLETLECKHLQAIIVKNPPRRLSLILSPVVETHWWTKSEMHSWRYLTKF